MSDLVTLVPLSALCGIVAAFVFRRFGSRATRQSINRILAHLMELRLFLDEPRLILRAQGNLLRENVSLLQAACGSAADHGAIVRRGDVAGGQGLRARDPYRRARLPWLRLTSDPAA